MGRRRTYPRRLGYLLFYGKKISNKRDYLICKGDLLGIRWIIRVLRRTNCISSILVTSFKTDTSPINQVHLGPPPTKVLFFNYNIFYLISPGVLKA